MLQHLEVATIISPFIKADANLRSFAQATRTHAHEEEATVRRRQRHSDGWAMKSNTQQQCKYRFSVCIELLHYWLWVINYGCRPPQRHCSPTPQRHVTWRGPNRPTQSHSLQLFAAPHPALLLIAADQLLKVVIIRGCERLKYGGVFGPKQQQWSLRGLFISSQRLEWDEPFWSVSDDDWQIFLKSLKTCQS